MRGFAIAMALLAAGLASCSDCKVPAGCLSADLVDGTCQCLEWQTVSVENVPVKYVVLSVLYVMPGSRSEVDYGWRGDPSGRRSEIGSRWRSVIRSPVGSEQVAAFGRLDVGAAPYVHPGLAAHPVTATSGAVTYEEGYGIRWLSGLDVPAKERDLLEVWVNPVTTVVTDHAGHRKVDWSWSGSCYGDACNGAMVLELAAGEIAGTVPSADPRKQLFLATLSEAERATLLRYHPLYDPPGRDPATLASDPRFLPDPVGEIQVPTWPSGSVMGNDLWTPCESTLSDAEFPVLGQMEVPFGDGALVVQHSTQSISPTCTAQSPHVQLGASPSCLLRAKLYVDRAFGTVLPVLTSVSAGCTGP
jgi:hypothetical protein